MFDPKVYRDLCRELRAPEDKIEEVIQMTKQTNPKRRRPVRVLLAAAAALALMVVGVSAAYPDAVQEWMYQIVGVVKVGGYRQDLTLEQGNMVTVFSVPEAAVENRDGRAILRLDGEETDITDALAADGRYVCERTDEGTRLTVTVEGSAEQWSMTVTLGSADSDSAPIYSFTSDSEGGADASLKNTGIAAEEGVEISGFTSDYDGGGITEIPAED